MYQWFLKAWPSIHSDAVSGWDSLSQHDPELRETGRLLTDVALSHADGLVILGGDASHWALGNLDTLRTGAEKAGTYFNSSWERV